jgi:rod shape-determining protein MreC
VVISSQQNNSKNRLFARNKRRSTGFLLAAMASLILMFVDSHYMYLNVVRTGFSILAMPLQYAVDYPVRVINWAHLLVSSKTTLVQENIRLHYQQVLLQADLQRLVAIKEENSQLKELLLTSSQAPLRAMAGQILAVDTSLARQLVILNKGKRDGVYIGQPVLDAKGIMGQIIDVGYMTSTVLLISDAKSAIPVRDNQTGEQAILVGLNDPGHLSLINLPKTSRIQKEDLLVTSGLGRLYPEGFPVGRVAEIHDLPGESFITVKVSPMALLHKNRLVLLIWPDREQVKITEQINERLQAMESLA